MWREELCHKIDREIMGSEHKDRALDLIHVTVKLDPDLLASLDALYTCWDEHNSIGAHKRGDDTSTAR